MSISVAIPFVELVTGLLSGLAAWQFGFGPEAISALVLIWVLIALHRDRYGHPAAARQHDLPCCGVGLGLTCLPSGPRCPRR